MVPELPGKLEQLASSNTAWTCTRDVQATQNQRGAFQHHTGYHLNFATRASPKHEHNIAVSLDDLDRSCGWRL